MANESRYDRGKKLRQQILGKTHSPVSQSGDAEFGKPFDIVSTEVAWGDIWSREALPLKTRSLLALAFLTAIQRPDQIALHVKGAIRNGNSKAEIAEVFLQAIVYCGFPAAGLAFKVAQETLAEFESETTD